MYVPYYYIYDFFGCPLLQHGENLLSHPGPIDVSGHNSVRLATYLHGQRYTITVKIRASVSEVALYHK